MAGRTRSAGRDWDDAHLINAAIDIHHDDPEFGYRFITDELAGTGMHGRRATGSTGSARTAAVVGARPQARPATASPGPPVHDDLVQPRVHRRRRRTCCG